MAIRTVDDDGNPLLAKREADRMKRLRDQSGLPVGEGQFDEGVMKSLLGEGNIYKQQHKEAQIAGLKARLKQAALGAAGLPLEDQTAKQERRNEIRLAAGLQVQEMKTKLAQMQTDLDTTGMVSDQQKEVFRMQLFGELMQFKGAMLQATGMHASHKLSFLTNVHKNALTESYAYTAAGFDANRTRFLKTSENKVAKIEASINAAKAAEEISSVEASISLWGNVRTAIAKDLSNISTGQDKAIYIEELQKRTDFNVYRELGRMKTGTGDYGEVIISMDKKGKPVGSSPHTRTTQKLRYGEPGTAELKEREGIHLSLRAAAEAGTEMHRSGKKGLDKLTEANEAVKEKADKLGPSYRTEYDTHINRLLGITEGTPLRDTAQSRQQAGGSGRQGKPPGESASVAEKKAYVEEAYPGATFDGGQVIMNQDFKPRSDGGPGVQPFPGGLAGADDGDNTLTWGEFTDHVKGQAAALGTSTITETRETLDDLYEGVMSPEPSPEDQMTKDKIIASPEFQKRYAELYGTADFNTDRAFKHFMGQVRFAGRQSARAERTSERRDVLKNPHNYPKAKVAAATVAEKIVNKSDRAAQHVNKKRRAVQEALQFDGKEGQRLETSGSPLPQPEPGEPTRLETAWGERSDARKKLRKDRRKSRMDP